MARGAPGVVNVQENQVTNTKHVTVPKNVLEDIDLEAQDIVLFYKTGASDDWSIRKISLEEKELVREAHKQGASVEEVLGLCNY
jgi:bifunctional DNA-binding transcriptional regulator/antitoxin component of YhaV-PrlF toxin-antitoxin module